MSYRVVEANGRYSVQNISDGIILKSKETGKIIAFAEIKQAENMCAYFQHHYDAIVECTKHWITKDGNMKMHRIRID